MANLNELEGLGSDAGFAVDPENIPEEPGGFQPPPPPGTYRFKLPASLEDVWETFEANINDKKVTRIRAVLRGADALTITQSKSGQQDNDSFGTWITNAERKRNKEGLMASDMLYLLRALGEDVGTLKTNLEYANALKKHAGDEFVADIEWSARCAEDKPIRALDEDGNVVVVEEQNGCGTRVYQQKIPKEDGQYKETFPCPDCGALLRAFANVAQFKALKK